MSSPGYVWEKMFVAVHCLCGEGTFKKRIADATTAALIRLNDEDLDGDLAQDLKFILDRTKRNMKAGIIQRDFDELERDELIKRMLHVLAETTGSERS